MKRKSPRELFILFLYFAIFAMLTHSFGDLSWRNSIGAASGAFCIYLMHEEIESLRDLFSISDRQLVTVSQQVADLQCELLDLQSELVKIRKIHD